MSLIQETSSFASATTKSQAFTSNVTAGSAIHVCVSYLVSTFGSGETCGISDTLGNFYTLINTIELQIASTGINFAHFYALSPSGGANTVTATPSGSGTVTQCCIAIKEFGLISSFDTHQEATQNAPGTGTDAVTTGTSTPSAQPGIVSAFILDIHSGLGTSQYTAGTGFSTSVNALIWNGSQQAGLMEWLHNTALAPIASTCTTTGGAGDNYRSMQALFIESGGGNGSASIAWIHA